MFKKFMLILTTYSLCLTFNNLNNVNATNNNQFNNNLSDVNNQSNNGNNLSNLNENISNSNLEKNISSEYNSKVNDLIQTINDTFNDTFSDTLNMIDIKDFNLFILKYTTIYNKAKELEFINNIDIDNLMLQNLENILSQSDIFNQTTIKYLAKKKVVFQHVFDKYNKYIHIYCQNNIKSLTSYITNLKETGQIDGDSYNKFIKKIENKKYNNIISKATLRIFIDNSTQQECFNLLMAVLKDRKAISKNSLHIRYINIILELIGKFINKLNTFPGADDLIKKYENMKCILHEYNKKQFSEEQLEKNLVTISVKNKQTSQIASQNNTRGIDCKKEINFVNILSDFMKNNNNNNQNIDLNENINIVNIINKMAANPNVKFDKNVNYMDNNKKNISNKNVQKNNTGNLFNSNNANNLIDISDMSNKFIDITKNGDQNKTISDTSNKFIDITKNGDQNKTISDMSNKFIDITKNGDQNKTISDTSNKFINMTKNSNKNDIITENLSDNIYNTNTSKLNNLVNTINQAMSDEYIKKPITTFNFFYKNIYNQATRLGLVNMNIKDLMFKHIFSMLHRFNISIIKYFITRPIVRNTFYNIYEEYMYYYGNFIQNKVNILEDSSKYDDFVNSLNKNECIDLLYLVIMKEPSILNELHINYINVILEFVKDIINKIDYKTNNVNLTKLINKYTTEMDKQPRVDRIYWNQQLRKKYSNCDKLKKRKKATKTSSNLNKKRKLGETSFNSNKTNQNLNNNFNNYINKTIISNENNNKAQQLLFPIINQIKNDDYLNTKDNFQISLQNKLKNSVNNNEKSVNQNVGEINTGNLFNRFNLNLDKNFSSLNNNDNPLNITNVLNKDIDISEISNENDNNALLQNSNMNYISLNQHNINNLVGNNFNIQQRNPNMNSTDYVNKNIFNKNINKFKTSDENYNIVSKQLYHPNISQVNNNDDNKINTGNLFNRFNLNLDKNFSSLNNNDNPLNITNVLNKDIDISEISNENDNNALLQNSSMHYISLNQHNINNLVGNNFNIQWQNPNMNSTDYVNQNIFNKNINKFKTSDENYNIVSKQFYYPIISQVNNNDDDKINTGNLFNRFNLNLDKNFSSLNNNDNNAQ